MSFILRRFRKEKMNCLICGFEFTSSQKLNEHLKTHNISLKEYYKQYIRNDEKCENINCCNPCHFISLNKGFRKYCSSKCSNSDVSKLNVYKETCMRKYGVENSFQSDKVKKKIKKSLIEKYGEDNPSKVSECLEKRKSTNIKKYGKDHPLKNKQMKEKIKNLRSDEYTNQCKDFLSELNLELIGKYENCKETITVKCLTCFSIFETQLGNLKQNCRRCEICHPKLNESLIENEIKQFIIENIEDEIILNSKNIIPPKELDIYIPSRNIAIEFHGLYWHSEEKGKDENYHLNKTKECENKNIKLIQIFEDEWLYKKEIVKNILLRGCVNNSTSVPEYYIKEISKMDGNYFLNTYDLLGESYSSDIFIGCFNQNILTSVMSFKIIENGIYIIDRFCDGSICNLGHLLAYFMRTYYWRKLFLNSDRRWFCEKDFVNYGFQLVEHLSPKHWFFKNGYKKRISEHTIENELNNSQENIFNYLKIWDCGQTKFKLENKEENENGIYRFHDCFSGV